MSIDVLEMRDRAIDALGNGVHAAAEVYTNMSFAEAACVAGFIVGILLLNVAFQRYLTRRRAIAVIRQRWELRARRMSSKRTDKSWAILCQAINDHLFEAECRGELSTQEVNDIYAEVAHKLDMPDLVPKKRRLKIVKKEINGRLKKGIAGPAKEIPGDKPPKIARIKFREIVGNVSKFFKKAA